VVAVVAETHCDLIAIVYASSGLFAACIAKYLPAEPTVVPSIEDCEYLVAVVAVSGLAIRHPFCLPSWCYHFCDLIFKLLSHLLDERLTF